MVVLSPVHVESLHEGALVDGDDVTLGNDRPARGHLPGLLQGVYSSVQPADYRLLKVEA
jgi:hypothetical protein